MSLESSLISAVGIIVATVGYALKLLIEREFRRQDVNWDENREFQKEVRNKLSEHDAKWATLEERSHHAPTDPISLARKR